MLGPCCGSKNGWLPIATPGLALTISASWVLISLSRASAHDEKAWRRFYDLAAFVIGKTDDVTGVVSLRAFVAENADLALVDDGDRLYFDEKTLVG